MSDGFNEIIHVPTRLRICSLLAEVGEAEFGVLRDALTLSDSVLSKHVKVLEQAGFANVRKGAVNVAAAVDRLAPDRDITATLRGMGITAVLLIASGIAVSWAAEATARGTLGINSFVGIRVGYVRHSPEAWLAGHRAARWPTHAAAGIFAASGILILALSPSENTAGGIVIGGSLGALGAVVAAAVRATRAAELVVVQGAGRPA